MDVSKKGMGLPENAYRKLKEGEVYKPVVPDDMPLPEITGYSLFWGMFYAVVFSAAAAYLGLKIGQVFEAAIPIAILAVGYSALTKRKNALSENVIVQSIGASSGVIVAGAIFTIPGLYILGLEATFLQVFLASLFGGFLGILFLIPFRRYFVKDMHGEFPFPEATATTEVLVAGEAGGRQAKILVNALIVGGIYDFLVSGLGFWKEVVSTRVFDWGRQLADATRLEFRMNIGAAVMGLGYIVGLKYALIIASGSFLAWWVILPTIYYIGQFNPMPILNAAKPISDMLPIEIFNHYVRHIGIGGIAAAGLIGVIKSHKIITGAFKLAIMEITGKAHSSDEEANSQKRTQLDIKMKWLALSIVSVLLGIFVFFLLLVVKGNLIHALVGLAIVTVISFLFTTVAARAIAIVGTNPVSGMTLMTLIISSVILVGVGLHGEDGMLAALIIGGVVCTALSMAGGFITDLKIGYWLGTTPRTQERFKFLGTILAAASVGAVIFLLHRTFGFGPGGLEAPQASAMAAVLKPLMTGQPAPWILYIAGVLLAIVLEFIGIPPLAFALGMYLPLHLNTPILAGGIIAHLVSKSTSDEKLLAARREKGTLIASGFIAGGAIMGVMAAIIVFIGQSITGLDGWNIMKAIGTEHWVESPPAEILGFFMFLLLLIFMYWDAKRAKVEE
ncbi:OPT family oligopeptide transporter [Caldithrix abyssi]|uniref:Oligopeptide transporter, OPT family n=1 Tax=Caldithrix abyssi DSM 13497 TaxID=880073 RepID=H1XV42_CALAY|nr:oligopeptide transporter, OPT family [Caldithrix abyssi]APF18915.1 putative oligopeptide transporter, OPT family [Caldithrix abyssi DSM 13497]EHO42875.1 oligopeptide transporter, OPT family [Caldithrix abyssi DSM 13497]